MTRGQMKDGLNIMSGNSRLGRMGFKSQDDYHFQSQILNTTHDVQFLSTPRKNSEISALIVYKDIIQTGKLYATDAMGE